MPVKSIPNSPRGVVNNAAEQQGKSLTVTWPAGCGASFQTGDPGLSIETGLVVNSALSGLPSAPNYNDAAQLCPDNSIPLVTYPVDFDGTCTITHQATHDCGDSVTALPEGGSGDRRNGLFYSPPSRYTGDLMREFVAALYGSDNPLFRVVTIPNPDSIAGALIDAKPEILDELAEIPSLEWIRLETTYGKTHSIYQRQETGKLDYYFLEVGAGTVSARKMRFGKCGNAIRKALAANTLPAGFATVKQSRVVMFADFSGLCPEKTATFSPSHNYPPLAHGWHGNDTGNQFKIVHWRSTGALWETALGTLDISISGSGTVTADYSGSAVETWWPDRAGCIFWVPTEFYGQVFNINTELNVAQPPGWPSAYNTGYYYVLYGEAGFMPLRYSAGTGDYEGGCVGFPLNDLCVNGLNDGNWPNLGTWNGYNGRACAIVDDSFNAGSSTRNTVFTGIGNNATIAAGGSGVRDVIRAKYGVTELAPEPGYLVGGSGNELPSCTPSAIRAICGSNYFRAVRTKAKLWRTLYPVGGSSSQTNIAVLFPYLDCDAAFGFERGEAIDSPGQPVGRAELTVNYYLSDVKFFYYNPQLYPPETYPFNQPYYTVGGFLGYTYLQAIFGVVAGGVTEESTFASAAFSFYSRYESINESEGDSELNQMFGAIPYQLTDFNISQPYTNDLVAITGAGNSIFERYRRGSSTVDADISRDSYAGEYTLASRFIGFT